MVRLVIPSVALSLALVGCETLRPAATLRPAGDIDPVRDRELAEKANEAFEASGVRVIRGAIPEGLDLQENGSKLVVLPGFERRYRVLGMVKADYTSEDVENKLRLVFWTYDGYDSTFRDIYCGFQLPFKWITLGTWPIVPLYYPCWKTAWSEETRAIELHESIKRGASVLGGNLVLITSEQSTVLIDSAGTQLSSTPSTALTGFALHEEPDGSRGETVDPEVR